MKTYAQSKSKQKFNWNKFIDRCIEYGIQEHINDYQEAGEMKVSNREYNKAVRMAASYITCAVGNQCETIPRDATGRPKDNHLANLGCEFYGLLTIGRRVHTAKNVLSEIEKRSAFILKEMENKQVTLF